MLAVLFAHVVATASAPLLVYRWGRKAFYPLALVPLGSLVWVALNWPGPGEARSVTVSWVSELSMDITLRFDALAAIMSVLVLGIGALVLFYCADYFHHHDGRSEKRLPSFAAELVAFAGAMFGLVISDNMLVLYVFWELTTVLSFLLVGHYAERASSRKAAVQALLVTTAGGLAMLVGIVILGTISGTYLLSELIAAPPSGLAVSVGIVLILVGALAKSAIVPLHFWLPGAMAAPTPVSAYLHAAAMVKAGVYLVARLNPGFADSPPWRPMVITLGVVTVLLAGWRAVREYDLKLILAFGTVSQLGFITVMVGAGGSDLMLAGLALLCAHAMFKAALFMVVGIIDHTTGTRDIRRLAWLGHASRPLLVIAVGATASMAALPPFLGFVAKEADYETLLHSESLGHAAPFVLGAMVAGSVFTTIYSLRFLWGAFARKGRPEPSKRVADMHPPPATFLGPPAILAAAGLVFGLWPSPLDNALDTYADTIPGEGDYELALWHGFRLPLLLSAVVLAVGTAAFFARARLRRTRVGYLPLGNADRIYDAVIRGADVLSVRLTGITQRGSIPATQSVILATLAIVPVVVLTLGARERPELALVGVAVAGGGRRADARRGGRRDGDAQPTGRGAAGRGHRLRLRHHLRVPRRTRPGVDAVPGGDAHARHLRSRAAHAARRIRPRQDRQAPAAARSTGAGGRRQRDHAGGLRDGGPHRRPDRRAAARRRLPPRTRRQHRQRAAGRHPGLGHSRRDLGAAGCRDRCRVNGVPAQALRRGSACLRRRPARHRTQQRDRDQPRRR